MKSTKHSILTSALTMLVCLCMFVGSTFAWFGDSVTSSNNIIQSGTLDLEMYWTDNLETGTWYNVEDAATNTVFNYDNWEPGYTDVRYIKIKNVGNLALNYQLAIEPQGKVGKLAEVINVYFANEGINIQTREDLNQLGTLGFLNHVMNGGATASGTLLPASQQSPLHDSGEIIVTMAMSMITTAGNEYQDETIGDGFTIKALATQASYEKDSFDELYDNNAELPESLKGDSASGTVTSENGVVTQPLTLKGKGITAYVPAGVLLEDGVTQLELTVTPLKSTTSDITVVNNEVLIPVDVHIEGISQNNTTPIIIDLGEVLPKYLNMGNYHLYHVEGNNNNEMALVDTKEELNAHNQYTYDLNTGAVTLAMATFSEVALVADTANGWNGEFDYSWYYTRNADYIIANADQLAAFGAIVGGMNGQTKDPFEGKTVKLISDINLGDGEDNNNSNLIFYPIGYYNSTGSYEKTSGGSVTSSVSSFKGTFDGNGHTISNFYQNTWEMFGDYNDGYSGTPNHYKDAMGLFGYVLNGTVKNLTVNNFSSDGEYTPTGVIAAYADGNSTFENIAIINCNPRVYNTGNGGIIGIAGDTGASNDDHITLKNVTVDNSNKISALWGSWDVACGGLVGMYRGNVDGSGNATGDTISFENCHVSAQIDVYNDVCANYQYYAYRYSGMMIGSVRHNTKNAEGKTIPNMTGISASGCTVNYGDWNDYYYCEFEKNTMASYSEDYQFSRVPHSELNFTDSNGNGVVDENERASVIGCKHTHTAEENHQAIYLPFHQLFTGYSWGVSSIGLEKYSGIVTDLGISEGDQQGSVEKFIGNGVSELENQTSIEIGTLFSAVSGLDDVYSIKDKDVKVFVSPANEQSNVTGIYSNNEEDWTKGTVTLEGIGLAKISITDYNFCKTTTITVNVKEKQDSVKFEKVFENTDKYIYRVGNLNEIKLESLFSSINGKEIKSSDVVVELKQNENNLAMTFNGQPSNWTQKTIKFEGTGLVTISITDKDKCIPTDLTVEVVDATNATKATSAKTYNVVLLNNVDFSTVEVSNGYTLYGNGFKMEAKSDVMYDALGVGFVTLKNGTLDNVQVVCPNFSYAIIYSSQIKNSPAKPTDSSNDARGNVRSAVMVDGNSKIVNSYVHGGRAAVFVRSGNLLVDSSTISGGAAANIHAVSAQSITLRNITLIQKPFNANVHDSSKTLMGFSGLFECDGNGDSTPLILEGVLIQDAWVNENYKKFVPSEASSIVSEALKKEDYLHDLDGDKKGESLNLGFTYIPQESGGSINENVLDNRTDKERNPYDYVEVKALIASAKVYSYINANGTSSDFSKEDYIYVPSAQGPTAPMVSYDDTNTNRLFETKFDTSDNRWESNLTVNLDNGNYEFDFKNLLVQRHGKDLSYSVKTEDGNVVDTSKLISLITSGVTDYVLNVEDGYTIYFKLTATKTSIPEPKVVDTTGGTPLLVVKSKNSDWSCAIPALDGIKINYYTSDGEVLLDLATLTPTTPGKQNGTNNYWETTKDGYKLKVTCGYIHDTKQVYGMPVVVDNNGTKQMYFTISSTNGYVSTGTAARSVTLTYEFVDPNGKTLTFKKSYNIKYADYKDVAQYSYSDFVKGNLTDLLASSGSSSCVTPDTLITLADGTQKRVDSLKGDEELLVWNLETGKYDKAPMVFIDTEEETEYEVVHLYFSDQSDVKVISEHGFFDLDLGKYVYIDAKNYVDYVGHKFVKEGNIDDDSWEIVTLDKVVIEKEVTTAWSPVTYKHLCYYTNGVLSMPGGIDGLFNIFDVNVETMRYDIFGMIKDLCRYGVFAYSDFEGMIPEEAYHAFNGQYLKVAIGKGLITWDDIARLAERYVPLMK